MTDSQGIIGARYRLLERIGRGGMGTVWRARDEVLGREVAVKEVVPSPDLTGPEREVFTVRTLREARTAGRIGGHPGVATVYDVIEENGRPWIIMQLIDSRTLGAVVREDGPLPPMRVARIGLEVLGALLAAHHAGVLHRDVKPDNVLLARDGRAVLTDFGIAVLEGDSSITRTGSLIGTPAFIAPERASGGPAEFASDLWSLGVTLYVAVEGRSPFERAHPLATLSAVMHQEPSPMRFAGPLAPVIFGLLHKDPARRMSARDVQIHLTSLVNGTAPEPTMPIELPAGPLVAPSDETRAGAPAGPSTAIPVVAAVPSPDGAPTAPAMATPPLPPGSGPEQDPAFTPRRRRRPAMAALVAATIAIAVTAGGAAWIAVDSSPPTPREQPTSASVAPDEKKPSNKPEQAKVPARDDRDDRNDRDGTSGRPAPERPRNDDPAPRDRPSGEPSEKPSPKPSQGPPDKPEKEPADQEQNEEQDQGEGAGEGSDQDTAPGEGQQGDSPDQVDPNAGTAALDTAPEGQITSAGVTGGPHRDAGTGGEIRNG